MPAAIRNHPHGHNGAPKSVARRPSLPKNGASLLFAASVLAAVFCFMEPNSSLSDPIGVVVVNRRIQSTCPYSRVLVVAPLRGQVSGAFTEVVESFYDGLHAETAMLRRRRGLLIV